MVAATAVAAAQQPSLPTLRSREWPLHCASDVPHTHVDPQGEIRSYVIGKGDQMVNGNRQDLDRSCRSHSVLFQVTTLAGDLTDQWPPGS